MLIVLFGPDGSGKSTLAKALEKGLKRRNLKASVSWMRGSHTLVSILSKILSRLEAFKGELNPYYGIEIPRSLARLWQFLEWVSAMPIILARYIQAQQLLEFLRQTSMQTLNFLNVWSLAVYAAIATASYVIATRLVTESSYELAMLRALGAKKLTSFTLVLTYTTTVAFLGSILGIALGTAGAQTASTIMRWIQPNVEIAPFPEAEQALQTLMLTLASSILGCV